MAGTSPPQFLASLGCVWVLASCCVRYRMRDWDGGEMKRRPPTQAQKEAVLLKQGNRCNLPECRKPLVSGLYSWDHIQDLQFEGDNEDDNWQAICTKPCHANKTKRASKSASRADRVRYGKPQKAAPMPGSRKSKVKKHVDGTWSYR